jgi:hypothetical protein
VEKSQQHGAHYMAYPVSSVPLIRSLFSCFLPLSKLSHKHRRYIAPHNQNPRAPRRHLPPLLWGLGVGFRRRVRLLLPAEAGPAT